MPPEVMFPCQARFARSTAVGWLVGPISTVSTNDNIQEAPLSVLAVQPTYGSKSIAAAQVLETLTQPPATLMQAGHGRAGKKTSPHPHDWSYNARALYATNRIRNHVHGACTNTHPYSHPASAVRGCSARLQPAMPPISSPYARCVGMINEQHHILISAHDIQ